MKYVNKMTADGLAWLDEKGNVPHTDKEGFLTRPFTLHVEYDSIRSAEKVVFSTGSVLPKTPAAAEKEKAEIRARADKEVERDWAEMEARHKVGDDALKKQLADHRARQASLPKRPTVTDPGAVTGNNQGGTVAVASPAKGSTKKKPASVPKSAAPNKAKAAPKSSPDGQPGKPENGLVYVRHMRSPRDAFILIKNPSVFGTESNWATKEDFPTKEEAVAWAKKHDLKVVNP